MIFLLLVLNTNLYNIYYSAAFTPKLLKLALQERKENINKGKTKVSSAVNDALDALKHAQDSLKSENTTILSLSSSNPGIPLSSLMAFLKKNSIIMSGIVLEDFDTAFTNKFYHSHLDLSNINSSAIVAAASLIARSFYILASDDKYIHSSVLGVINVNTSLVEELMGCLLNCELGLSCVLVKSYIAPTNACPSHFVGVVIGEPSSKPYLGYVDDVSRFVWNFLADRTSIPKENASSGCSKDCSQKDEVCMKAETNGKGVVSSPQPGSSIFNPIDVTIWNLECFAPKFVGLHGNGGSCLDREQLGYNQTSGLHYPECC